MELYKRELQEMFDNGKNNRGDKEIAEMMLLSLTEKYPNRFTIPSRETIKMFISSQYARQKAEERSYQEHGADGTQRVFE